MKLVRNSFVAAALLAAAQVGVGSGLGVLDWPLSFSAVRGWGQLLTWVAFIFAAGVAGGAVVGRRALRRPRPDLSIWGRLAAACAAGVGGAVAVPLVWIPVRVSQPIVDGRAEVTMVATAGVAVLVGLVLAVIALTWRPVGAGIAASATWVWLFALASVGLAAKDHVRVSPRLGMIDAPQFADDWWLGTYLMVGIAAVLGLAVAAVAGWKGAGWLGITLSGLAGPALVASAYLTTGWGISGNGEEIGPYLASLLAVGAGVLASMAVASATVPHRPPPRPAPPAPADARGALATLPAPLAITSYAEPAYVLESSAVEPAYRRQPAFYTETIYLPGRRDHNGQPPPVRPEPASRPDLNRRPEPAAEATYEPPYEEPYESPYDPARPPPASAPAASGSRSTSGSASGSPSSAGSESDQAGSESYQRASESYEVGAGYEAGHAAPVRAVVVEPLVAGPVIDAVLVEPERAGRPAAHPAPDVTAPAPTSVPTTPAPATSASSTPAASPADGPAGAAKPAASTGDGKRKGREKDKERRASGRRAKRPDNEAKSRTLRQGERDHIDWIDNLVKLPVDPTLKMTKER